MSQKIKIFKLNDTLIIKKEGEDDFFYTTSDSFIIPVFHFSVIIKYLLTRGLLSPKVLEGILDEFYNR